MHSQSQRILEVCVDSVHSAELAVSAGADRIELCTALEIGGVTPPGALIRAVLARVNCPVVVLIRPRGGNFVYSPTETQQIIESVEEALALGADGVAVGALAGDGQLAVEFLAMLRDRCEKEPGEHSPRNAPRTSPVQWVMHRAFDQVGDKFEALDALVQLGFDRILTSGGPETATEGIAMLKALQTRAAGRMAIMPGGGVSTINAADILSATGCWQIHGSFRCPAVQDFSLKHFGAHRLVDAEAVAACVDALRR